MNEDDFIDITELEGKDKFKKVRFSPDSTDTMSDFSDK